MLLLPVIDKFLRSVVVLTVSTGYQKDTGLLVQVKTNFPDPTIYLPASVRREFPTLVLTMSLKNLVQAIEFCKV